MARFTVTLNSKGPSTRQELIDAIQAFAMLKGECVTSIVVPQALYDRWMKWAGDEKGLEGVLGGIELSVGKYWAMR